MTGKPDGIIERSTLLRRILAALQRIVVLDAVAGMGRSVLLGQLAQALGAPVQSGAAPDLARLGPLL